MEFSIDAWLDQLAQGLRDVFGSRLLFLGLQGSYRRGEATDKSDIDVVAVLDVLAALDLEAYRRVLKKLPYGEKACGFICGREELFHWPAYDRFQLFHDTRPLIGDLEALMPPLNRKDAAMAARIGAANLYHRLCHGYLYGSPGGEDRQGTCKAALFILQAAQFARSGRYPATREDVINALDEEERAVLCPPARTSDPAAELDRLLVWCRGLLKEMDTEWER